PPHPSDDWTAAMPQAESISLIAVAEGEEAGLSAARRAWAEANGFSGQRGRLLPLPDGRGRHAGFLFGTGAPTDRPAFVSGLAAAALGPGRYRLEGDFGDPTLAAI